MDIRWSKIRSWHALTGIVSRSGLTQTMCGRWAKSEIVDDLPSERSCETCLRIVARLQDAG
jgi:hypothetical protein